MTETNYPGFPSLNKKDSCDSNDSYDSIEKKDTSDSNQKNNSKKKVFFFILDSSNIHNEVKNNNFRKRKYTMEQKIITTSDFVPKLKPIKTKLIPPKFYLNEKKSDEKSKSCPSSDLEDYDDDEEEEEENEKTEEISTKNINKKNIKNTRKDLEKIKDNKIIISPSEQFLILKDTKSIGEKLLFEKEENIFPEIEPFEDKTPKCDYNDKNFKMFVNLQIKSNDVNNIEKFTKKKGNSLLIIDALKRRNKN